MPSLNERVELKDMHCPVCNQPGSTMLLVDPKYFMRSFHTDKGWIFIHLSCADNLVKDWVETNVGKVL